MLQGLLPFKYESEKNKAGLTAFAGLPVYLDMSSKMGLSQSINKHLSVRKDSQGYKVFGIVTNMDWNGNKLIHWHHERRGKSEQAHSVMKSDLAGGKLPSSDFGENAAWWWIMMLSLNLNEAMKSLAMGKSWSNKRIKAIRFSVINIAGRVMERSRQLLVRVSKEHPSFDLIVEIRKKISQLSPVLC